MSFSLTKQDLDSLTDDQKTAIIESLLVAVVADRKTPRSETDKFDAVVEAIPWGLDRERLIANMTAARGRILALKDQDAAIALIKSIGVRLPEIGVREKVFRAMGAIMFSDGELSKGEINVLGKYATAFDLAHDRLEAIKADILAEINAAPRTS
jgi:hypothetical protein